MPFQPEFWNTARHIAAAIGKLDGIKGFISALPVEWTRGENNHFPFSSKMLTLNDKNEASPVGSPFDERQS